MLMKPDDNVNCELERIATLQPMALAFCRCHIFEILVYQLPYMVIMV